MATIQTLVGKARQAEAKAALGAMFQTLKVFHSESGSYTMCLAEIGSISRGGTYDFWQIDERGVLTNIQSGL